MKLVRALGLSFLLSAIAACGGSNAPDSKLDNRPAPSAEITGPNASTTSIASSLNPATYGQGVTFTATVVGTAPHGVPAGTVQFKEGSSLLGTGTLAPTGGAVTSSATFTATTALTAGSHSVTAVYLGDPVVYASSQSTVSETINKASVSMIINSAPASPAAFGQGVIFSVSMTAQLPSTAVPTGTAQLFDNSTQPATPLGTVTLDSSGNGALPAISSLIVGGHPIVASYTDTAGNFNNTTAGQSPTLDLAVEKADTTTSLAVSPASPTRFGQAVTLTATVAVQSPGSGSPWAQGATVAFFDGETSLGAVALGSGSTASTTVTLAGDPAGHDLFAVYAGDGNFNTSEGSASQAVIKSDANLALTSSGASVHGENVTFTAAVTAAAPGVGSPSGTVAFFENGNQIGSATLSGGFASVSTSGLSTASHSITASYSGDADFNGTVSPSAISQDVSRSPSAAVVSLGLTPSVFGQSVGFSVAVFASGAGAGQPTGSVQFSVDGASVGSPVALGAGTASISTAALSVGTHAVTAAYSGDANFEGSAASAQSQVVNQASTTVAIDGASVAPSVFGQPVTFSASVAAVLPGAGVPSGTLQFLVDGQAAGSPVALVSGAATSAGISNLSFGPHAITAVYSGATSFVGSTSSAFSQFVNKADTTGSIASSAGTSVSGQPVSFIATFVAAAPGAGPLSGTVQFTVDGASSGAPVALVNGSATSAAVTPSVASHSVGATYSGDGSFNGSDAATFEQTVNKASVANVVSADVNASVVGQPVTFTATFAAQAPGVGTPTGTVDFLDLTAGTTLASGVAIAQTPSSAVDQQQTTSVSSFNLSAGGSVGQTFLVGQSGRLTGIQVDLHNCNTAASGHLTLDLYNSQSGWMGYAQIDASFAADDCLGGLSDSPSGPSTFVFPDSFPVQAGESYRFQVIRSPDYVAADGAETRIWFASSEAAYAGGTANIANDGPLGGDLAFRTIVLLNGGGGTTATFTTSALLAGSHQIVSHYNGDGSFAEGSSEGYGQVVNQASTAVTVASSGTPSVFSQPVTFSATVAASSPGAGSPTGIVTFSEGGNPLGSGEIVEGVASFSTSGLGVGAHSITATYAGDANYATSASSASQQVDKAGSVISNLTTSATPSVSGQSVTFSAGVDFLEPATLAPVSGTITFKDGSTTLGTADLADGVASLSVSNLAVATHSITATYGGNGSFNGSDDSSPITQVVNLDPTSTAIASGPSGVVSGQAVTFTATVTIGASGSGIPTGTVTFFDGSSSIGSGALSGSSPYTATFTTSSLSTGGHLVTASYSGDAKFATSTSSGLAQSISKASASNVVSSAPAPSTYGQGVTFTASLAAILPGSGTPTGTVQFFDGPTSLGSAPVASGAASITTLKARLGAGNHSITAVYSGDANFAAVTSAPYIQTANKADTTMAVVTSLTPTVFGQPMTFTATVGVAALPDQPSSVAGPRKIGVYSAAGNTSWAADVVNKLTASGIYDLVEGHESTSLPTPTLAELQAYDAVLIYSNYSFANGTTMGDVLADYVDGGGRVVIGAFAHNTFAIGGRLASGGYLPLVSGPFSGGSSNASLVADDVTDPLLAGVTFFSGGRSGYSNNVALASGARLVAHWSTGARPLIAVKGNVVGLNFFPPSSDSISSGWTSSSDGTRLMTNALGGVADRPVGPPTGSVSFVDGETSLGTVALVNGVASFSMLPTARLAVGSHVVTASYQGDANFNTSNGNVGQVVNKADVAVAVSSGGQTVYSQTATLSATVAASSPGAGQPGGTISFFEGSTALGTGAIVSGSTSITIATLDVGAHSITATYNGDGSFNAGDSSQAATQTVNKASASMTLASSINATVFGQATTFTAVVSPTAPAIAPADGTVTFYDGETAISAALPLDGNTAAFSTALLATGTHQITAVYSGSDRFNAATSGVVAQVVNKADTFASVSSNRNPAAYGQNEIFTAAIGAVLPGAGAPSGTVDFYDTYRGGAEVLLGSGAISDGIATFDTSTLNGGNEALQGGSHSISVQYRGDGSFNGSLRSSSIAQQINPFGDASITPFAVNPPSSVFGQAITFSATVRPCDGSVDPTCLTRIPTGSVSFKEGSNVVASGTLDESGSVAVPPSAALAKGLHTIVASYSGDRNYAPYTTSATVTENVGSATTTTTIASSANVSVYGQPITLTATVTADAPSNIHPSGTVLFVFGTQTLGAQQLTFDPERSNVSTASLTISTLAPGDYSFSATYLGDPNLINSSSSPLAQTVGKASTSAALASSIATTVFGQATTFTATFSPQFAAASPTGLVTFTDGITGEPAVIGTAALIPGAEGLATATLTVSTLSVRAHTIGVSFGGDANYNGSSASTPQTVNAAATSTRLIASQNPAAFGQPFSFSAAVRAQAPGAGVPSGNVVFAAVSASTSQRTVLSTKALDSSGNVTVTSAEFPANLPTDSYVVTASFAGEARFTASADSLTEIVNQFGASIAVASNKSPSVVGESVTFTAQVSSTSGRPTGAILFSVDGQSIGSAIATDLLGRVTYATSALSVGTHTIAATYQGDRNFAAATASFLQGVNQAATTTSISSSTDGAAIVHGQAVTFFVSVAAVAPGAGMPAGAVQLIVDGKDDGSAAALDGQGNARFTLRTLAVGSRSISAAYLGNGSFSGSDASATPVQQQVNKAATATTVVSSAPSTVVGQAVAFTATVVTAAPGSGLPTGSVDFYAGSVAVQNQLGSSPVSAAGTAVISTAALPVGSDSVIAVYSGDGSSLASTSSGFSETITKDGVLVAIAPTANPGRRGTPVVFNVTVTAATVGAVDGQVALTIDGVPGGAQGLTNGATAFTISGLAIGSHTVSASYTGGSTTGNGSALITEKIDAVPSAAQVSSSARSAVFGQSVTLTADVTSAGQTPTGTVTFFDGATAIGAAAAITSGQASVTTSALALGGHLITASYSGDANSAAATSAAFLQQVNVAATTVSVSSPLNPSNSGAAVTFSATVTATSPASGIPTGSVGFLVDGVTSAAQVNESGVASMTLGTLPIGSHIVSAYYQGDGNFAASLSGTVAQVVSGLGTSVSVASSQNPSQAGEPVTFTATVTDERGGSPSGSVSFFDGAAIIGSVNLSAAGEGFSSASINLPELPVGTHAISATYSGDTRYTASSSAQPLSQVVGLAVTSMAVTSSANPASLGQTVVFTAAVSSTSPAALFGSVSFADGERFLGVATLNGVGRGSISVSSLGAGSHVITASYASNGLFAASTGSLTEVVQSAATAVAVSSSQSPAVFGQPVTLSAAVTSGASGTITGSVTFTEGSTVLGTSALSSGSASITVTPALGSHSIVASYGGDATFTASASATFVQSVAQASSSAVLTSSARTALTNETVVFTAKIAAVLPGRGIPTGSVQFKDGAATLGSGALDGSGTATFSTATLVKGAHQITAVYAGDTNFAAVTSAQLAQFVATGATSTSVASSVSPSQSGQAVVFTANVTATAPATGTPTGAVLFVFLDGSAPNAIGQLSNGVATASVSTLAVGTFPISAVYLGDPSFAGSTSAAIAQTVGKAATTATLATSAASPVYGQPVTLTAHLAPVAPGAGFPQGSAVFMDGAATVATVALDAAGSATFVTSALAVGSHGFTVSYAGDARYTGSASASVAVAVGAASTTAVLTSSSSPSVFGQAVIFTAAVAAVAPGAAIPSGSVHFTDGSLDLGTSALDPAGVATLQLSALPVGSHVITAAYLGSTNHLASASAAVTQVVNQDGVSVTLASSVNPSVYGGHVVFTAVVAPAQPGSGVPTGTVSFHDGAADLGTIAMVNGVAAVDTAALTGGAHSITAVYSGDVRYSAGTNATATVGQQVNVAPTTAAVVASASPSALGQPVTLTATLASPAVGLALTGSVIFTDGPNRLGQSALDGSGTATFTTSTLPVGVRSLHVSYAGDVNYAKAESAVVLETITQAPTSTALVSSASPSAYGQGVTLTATVALPAPGQPIPTGVVTFTDGGQQIGSAVVSITGQATFAASAFAVGSHNLTAVYGGDANYLGSASGSLVQSVTVDAIVVTIASSGSSTWGQSVTFDASVRASAPGAGVPTGSLTFTEGSTVLGTAALSHDGAAEIDLAGLSVGSHSITATYGGDANFAGGSSSAMVQVVALAPTAAALTSSIATSVWGQQVNLTAIATSVHHVGSPDGSVTFLDGANVLGTSAVDAAGRATLSTAALTVGAHSLTAVYGGSVKFAAATASAMTATVQKAGSAATMISSVSPAVFGQPVTFTVSVAAVAPGAGSPSGSVTLLANGTPVGAGTLGSNGRAAITVASLPVNAHSMIAAYAGDANFVPVQSTPLAQPVLKDGVTVALTTSASTTAFGGAVVLSARVSAASPGVGMPTGTVVFSDGATPMAAIALDGNGVATFSSSKLAVGVHALTASYSGDDTDLAQASASVLQTTTKAATSVKLTSSTPTRTIRDQNVFTVQVSAAASPITGSVTLLDGTSALETADVDPTGAVTFKSITADPGAHVYTAVYNGNASFLGSTSAAVTDTVTNPIHKGCSTTGTGAGFAFELLAVAMLVLRRARKSKRNE